MLINMFKIQNNFFIGPNTVEVEDPFYSFTRYFASSQHNLCTLVLAMMSVMSLLHTVFRWWMVVLVLVLVSVSGPIRI
jgi:hypothetical protein